MEYVTLANGVKMPELGYGVYQVTKEECERCVSDALSVGYRHIDTAQSYFNEEEVGNAIKKSGIPREELFITTKVWIEHYGYEECRKSVLESLRKLQLDYIDLMLLHQSCSSITSTLCFCTNRLPITTAHGELWKSCMQRENCAPSAFPTSTRTGW